MAVQQWTANPFELSPADSDSPAEGAERIRELKETAGSLLDKEHKARDAGSVAAQGWHRSGSAIAYYAGTEPTTRPDGTTALAASDAGRLWTDSGDGTLDYWDGSSFEDLKVPEIDLIRDHLDKSADYTITDTDANTVFVTTAATDRTITLPTAADNAGRIITVKKVDDGTGKVIIDGEGAETIDGAATVDVSQQYSLWRGMCDGTEWHTISSTGTVEFNFVGITGTLSDGSDGPPAIVGDTSYVAGVYVGSVRDQLAYPIGTILAVYVGAAKYDRNASVDVRRSFFSNHTFVDSGFTGTSLTGVWRSSGESGVDRILARRVS